MAKCCVDMDAIRKFRAENPELIKKLLETIRAQYFKPLYGRDYLCNGCLKIKSRHSGRWLEDLKVWVCYDCYPTTKCLYGKKLYY